MKYKKIAATFAVILMAGLTAGGMRLYVNSIALTTAATTDWRLKFRTEGELPDGNASTEQLAKYNTWFHGDTEDNVLYLTFDTGYENGYTEQILDTLAAHGVPAAFFIVGNYTENSPDILKRMVAEGHIVGNHTATHPNMSKIEDISVLKSELETLERDFFEVTGVSMSKYYRPPQGKYSEQNLQNASNLSYKTIFWSLAYVDWYVDNQPTREEAIERLIPRTHPGAVVLLHSTSKTNAEILDELITTWLEMGYRFGTLDELTADTSEAS